MRKGLALAVVLILLTVITGTASALPGITIDATFNLPMPMGEDNFKDNYKPGFGAGADVFIMLPIMPGLKIGGRVAYNRFGVEDPFEVKGVSFTGVDGSMSIVEILPSIRKTFGPPLSPIKAFIQFGAGMYATAQTFDAPTGVTIPTESTTDFGISIGAGLRGKILPGMGLIVYPLYHIIFTEEENTSYLSANIGITF